MTALSDLRGHGKEKTRRILVPFSRASAKQQVGREEIDVATLSRQTFNKVLRDLFVSKGWKDQPPVFSQEDELGAKMDFLKDRVGIEVGFGHASFMGIDLLKFQVCSYSWLDHINVSVYITTTKQFQRRASAEFNQNWERSLTYEKVRKYLPHFTMRDLGANLCH